MVAFPLRSGQFRGPRRRPASGVKLDRPIVLVGLMGAGKSSVGRRLANRLAVPFHDADAEIEAAAGMTVAEIFEELGEPAFRDGERRVIARLLAGAPGVIATGGGAYMDPATRAAIRERAIAVWLRVPLDVLVARVGHARRRPLLANGDPRAILSELMAKRDPVYAEADLVVDSGIASVEQTVDSVLAALAPTLGHR